MANQRKTQGVGMAGTNEGRSLYALRHRLAEAENEAGLALSRLTKALIAWSDAMKRCYEHGATLAEVDAAEDAFQKARAARVEADRRVEELSSEFRAATGSLPRPEVA